MRHAEARGWRAAGVERPGVLDSLVMSLRRCAFALALTVTTSVVAGVAAGCPGKETDTKRVLGTEGRERWVVTFEGNEPDLAEYRALMKDNPAEAEAYAEKMRKKLETDHEDLAKTLESLNGRIVERWWMSQSVTVEIDAAAAPSLEKVAGVKSLTPDVPLDP